MAVVVAEQNWVNGDILETIPNDYPFLSHYAILVQINNEWWVLHNNETHGVNRERLESLLSRHKLNKVHSSPLSGKSTEFLMQRFKNYEGIPYDPVGYNCETFVADFAGLRLYSKQSVAFGLLILVIIFLALSWILKKLLN